MGRSELERLSREERNKVEQVVEDCRRRTQHIGQFVAAYRQYCWPVASLTDLKLAPFHLLASEGRVHTDKNHTWHMDTLAAVCRADPEWLLATPYRLVDVDRRIFDPDKARQSTNGKPSPRMDAPKEDRY